MTNRMNRQVSKDEAKIPNKKLKQMFILTRHGGLSMKTVLRIFLSCPNQIDGDEESKLLKTVVPALSCLGTRRTPSQQHTHRETFTQCLLQHY